LCFLRVCIPIMKPDPTAPEPDDPRTAAQYIEAMARDLKGLALTSGLPFLAYLLGMVEADASSTARRTRPNPDADAGPS